MCRKIQQADQPLVAGKGYCGGYRPHPNTLSHAYGAFFTEVGSDLTLVKKPQPTSGYCAEVL